MINDPTHKNGNILDLLFTNVPDLVSDIRVLKKDMACVSDHFGIQFNLKLDVSLKKTVKRKVPD